MSGQPVLLSVDALDALRARYTADTPPPYRGSKWTQYRGGDSEVLALIDEVLAHRAVKL